MPKYLVEATYGPEGFKGVLETNGSARRKVVEQTVAEVRGKLEAFYFAFGERDAVIVVDLPTNEAAAALSLVVNASGALRSNCTPLLTPEEIDAAVKDRVTFRPPGQ